MFQSSLPFSSVIFFQYMLAAIVFLIIAKYVLSKFIPYKYILALITISYIILLFPKPFHIMGLIFFLYTILSLLRKFYTKDNIILPMVLLSLPIFLMKTTDVISINPNSDLLKIIRIAGLSYMVFKVISLYIDQRRDESKINFIDFFNYTAFVPTLLIGPLDRFNRFKNDTENGYKNMTLEMGNKAINNLILGLLFKFILAEAIRRLILVYLVNDGSIIYHLSYMYTYLFYLFFDFAGYSLLAISFGNFMGIDVPINFDKPFNALNPKEFWKKWHKSLGDWLNDYFFKPIFKYFTTKKIGTSIQRQNMALLLTFTLMGFWNGFKLHYIVSGILFGLYSMLHNYYFYKCKKNKRDVIFGNMDLKIVKGISIFLMVNSVAFAIYIFSGKLF
jgi:membrane protein involved in D-alanine export